MPKATRTSAPKPTPYSRPAYKPPSPKTDDRSSRESIVVCEPMVPVYQKIVGVCTIGSPTSGMYQKMLPAFGDNAAFETILEKYDVPINKKFADKTDKHYLVPTFSPEIRDMIIAEPLPKTKWPSFDKSIFNVKTLEKNVVDLVYSKRDDSNIKDAYFFGSQLYHVRNLIFDQDTKTKAADRTPSEYKYGTYFGQKGYKICTTDTSFDQDVMIAKLAMYGLKTTVYEGVDLE